MLVYILHPILGALCWSMMDELADEDRDRYIDACWHVLFARQFERRGCKPWGFLESAIKAPHYAWRGTDERGGNVLGL